MLKSRKIITSHVTTHSLCPTTARCHRRADIPLAYYGRLMLTSRSAAGYLSNSFQWFPFFFAAKIRFCV